MKTMDQIQADFIQIREQQRQSWNKFSPGWKKWDRLFMDFLEPMGNEIIRQLSPSNTDTILDVAAGTGEPGLTIAAGLPSGRVVVTDLAEDMLAIAEENAIMRGISNIETVACDVCELPFDDQSFDGISCRLGFMFFPDMKVAAKEMHRVLRPGGRLSTSVWNVPEKNFWITAMTSAIQSTMSLPPPVPGAPGMFRCAKNGLMEDILEQAGFANITRQEVHLRLKCRTTELYWSLMTELAAPVVAALSQADEKTIQEIRSQVRHTVLQKCPEGLVQLEGSSIILSGEKKQ